MNKLDLWQEVPDKLRSEWYRIFSNDNEGIFMKDMCPVCNTQNLHCYYQVYRNIKRRIDGILYIGSGAKWEWCSKCKTYEHSSSLVPEWWNLEVLADLDNLTLEPKVLDDLIIKIKNKDVKTRTLR